MRKGSALSPTAIRLPRWLWKRNLYIVKSNATDKEYASAARAIKLNTSVYPRMHSTSTSTCTVAQCAFSSTRMNGLMLCTFCVLFFFFLAECTFCLIVALEWWFKDQRKHFHVGGVLIIIIKVDLKRANRHSVDFTHHQYHD